MEDGRVRFEYRDRRDGNRVKVAEVSAEEFIRRFLLHVLPPGTVRIRSYGFLANAVRKIALARCREGLGEASSSESQSEAPEPAASEGSDRAACPKCGSGRLEPAGVLDCRLIERLTPEEGYWDSP